MEKIKSLFSVLKIGNQLRNSKMWKSVQSSYSLVGALLAALVVFFPSFVVSQELIDTVSLAISYAGEFIVNGGIVKEEAVKAWLAGVSALVMFGVNWYITNATSKTIGIGKNVNDENSPSADASVTELREPENRSNSVPSSSTDYLKNPGDFLSGK